METSLRSIIPLTSLSLKKNACVSYRKQRQEDEACKARLGLISMNFFQRNETKFFHLNSVTGYQISRALIFTAAHNAHIVDRRIRS